MTVGYTPGRPVLTGFSLHLRGAGVLHVAGSNGSGKSTLVEVASGYLRPWAGSVRVAGTTAHDRAARQARRVCRTTPALYPTMTVRDHVVFAARCAQVDPADGLARAARYGLGPWLEHSAESVSTGNRRKLWLVMCTLGRFAVVLLDEPFNGLDAQGADVLRDELRTWAEWACVLVVAHVLPPGTAVDGTVELPAPELARVAS